jgi:hypothetical protein
MKKTFRKQQEESQIVWRNTNHDTSFNPIKKFYGVIKVGDKLLLTEYESKFRSEVVAIFNEEARLLGGKLDVIGVYK